MNHAWADFLQGLTDALTQSEDENRRRRLRAATRSSLHLSARPRPPKAR